MNLEKYDSDFVKKYKWQFITSLGVMLVVAFVLGTQTTNKETGKEAVKNIQSIETIEERCDREGMEQKMELIPNLEGTACISSDRNIEIFKKNIYKEIIVPNVIEKFREDYVAKCVNNWDEKSNYVLSYEMENMSVNNEEWSMVSLDARSINPVVFEKLEEEMGIKGYEGIFTGVNFDTTKLSATTEINISCKGMGVNKTFESTEVAYDSFFPKKDNQKILSIEAFLLSTLK